MKHEELKTQDTVGTSADIISDLAAKLAYVFFPARVTRRSCSMLSSPLTHLSCSTFLKNEGDVVYKEIVLTSGKYNEKMKK
jgi:hypothetical protein